MSDYEGYASDEEDDYGWIYVEDHYDEIDDLVEHACPSPTMLPVPEVGWSYDPYAYFEDIEYLSDAYFDNEHDPRHTKKRKRDTAASDDRPRKRNSMLKKTSTAAEGPATQSSRHLQDGRHIMWRTSRSRDHDATPVIKPSRRRGPTFKTFALLRDWKNLSDHDPLMPAGTTSTRTGKDVNSTISEHEEAENDGDCNEGLDIGNLASVAGLLQGETLEALKKQLQEKGLDPGALEIVLQDFIEGREPEFEEIGDEENTEDGQTADEESHRHHHDTANSRDLREDPPRPRNIVPSKDRRKRKEIGNGLVAKEKSEQPQHAPAEASQQHERSVNSTSIANRDDDLAVSPSKASASGSARRSKRTRGADQDDSASRQPASKRKRVLRSRQGDNPGR